MLKSLPSKSTERDPHRRWMSDDYFDLIVWTGPDGVIHGFHLCYDKPGRERALVWSHDRGFSHALVDTGESSPNANRTPVLVAGGIFHPEEILEEFIARGRQLPVEIRKLVLEKIVDYQKA